MAGEGYIDLPFPEAVRELRLARRLGGRILWRYYETFEEEIARIESDPVMLRSMQSVAADWREKARQRARPMTYVRYWPDDAVIDGDLDLDAPFDPHLIKGFAIDGNATVSGSITNWEPDTRTSFLSVVGDLSCRDFVVGASDIVVLGNVRAAGVIVVTGNDGRLEIKGDVHAGTFINDSDRTERMVHGDIHAVGWTWSENGDLPLPVSDWRDEIRPEFIDEFFLEDGDFRNPNGNADIVTALIAGRDILKRRPRQQ